MYIKLKNDLNTSKNQQMYLKGFILAKKKKEEKRCNNTLTIFILYYIICETH